MKTWNNGGSDERIKQQVNRPHSSQRQGPNLEGNVPMGRNGPTETRGARLGEEVCFLAAPRRERDGAASGDGTPRQRGGVGVEAPRSKQTKPNKTFKQTTQTYNIKNNTVIIKSRSPPGARTPTWRAAASPNSCARSCARPPGTPRERKFHHLTASRRIYVL